MKENVGTIDRVARSIAGPALMVLGYKKWGGEDGSPLGLLTIIGGVTLIESAITRVCPVNRLLGIDTREPELVYSDLARELDPEMLLKFSSDIR